MHQNQVEVDLIQIKFGIGIDVRYPDLFFFFFFFSISQQKLTDCYLRIAAQPPPSKHLTDEELKQQYGIHMTSRIQEDGGGTEGKWADIEDDEDDWAPETIEWTDGTKTNLTNTEPPQPPGPDIKPAAEPIPTEAPPQIEEATTLQETSKYIPKPTTSIGPNPTVLKLGANAERQAKSTSISSKGINDKSSSASSSPAPPPAKSPWAPLPPVDRASPVVPPAQLQPPSRPPPNREPPQMGDGSGVGFAPSGFPPGGPPQPKEIAADDFNRSWKEMQTGAPRELFNSRSGRYEPVPETRKGPWRNEQASRGPSLLQRPVPGEQTGPAEPSAAFQTHRSVGQDGPPWTRRRTSSNVSGGSGGFARRMSIGRPDMNQRIFEGRRGSLVNGTIEPQVSNRELPHPKGGQIRDVSPARQVPGPAWPPRASVNMNEMPAAAASGMPQQPGPAAVGDYAAAPQVPQEDPVAMQERIMKEKRMEARQRRIEQEEKEEAAKRERIRQKLEALGPAPEKQKPQRMESHEPNQPESVATPAPAAAAVASSQSPPKPPVPEPTGEPKQYGMMKVHHPDTVKRLVSVNERERPAEKPTSTGLVKRPPTPVREPRQEATVADGLQQPQPGESPTQIPVKIPEPQVDEQSTQWRNNLHVSSSYSPWSPSNKFMKSPPSLTNPWKPLSNDRTLGNGIFDQPLGGFPAKDLPLRSHLTLDQPSIVPGAQPFSAPSRSPQEATSISPLPSPEVRNAPYDPLSPIGHPGPIGPPSTQHSHWPQEPRTGGTAAWNNFHVVAARRDAEESEKRRNELNAFREGPSSLQVNFNETWRQVRTGDQAGQRQVVGIARPAEPSVPAPNPLSSLDDVGGLPFPDSHARPLASVLPRSSRFFPQAMEQVKKPVVEDEFIRSPSPPPPEEMSSHPVYTSSSSRPLVHLPGPKPVVKLPPKAVAAPPAPPTFASMVATPPRNQPSVSTATTWQEKINGLFGKKTTPEKRNALAVTSASKEPLDVPLHIAAVSVSLPHNLESDSFIGDGERIGKQVEEEEAIFEDREAGSQPVVRVPNMAPPAAWLAAPPPQSRSKSKNLTQAHSIEPYLIGFQEKDSAGNPLVSIRFPGADAAKTLTLPKKAGGSHGSRQRGASSFKPRKGGKSREGPGGFNSKKSSSSQQTGGSPRHPSRNGSWGPRTSSGSR